MPKKGNRIPYLGILGTGLLVSALIHRKHRLARTDKKKGRKV